MTRIRPADGSYQNYRFVIGDDGVGLSAVFNPVKSRTLGMRLICGLSKQLGRTLEISHDKGVPISLTFSEEKWKKIW